jgi:hypothetical protein
MDGKEVDLPERVVHPRGAEGNDEPDNRVPTQGQPGSLRTMREHGPYLLGTVGAFIESGPLYI